MITIVSGTDRADSKSLVIANILAQEAEKQGVSSQVFSMADLPSDFFTEGAYGEPPASFKEVLNTHFRKVNRFVFVVPEYNGSYPGILKYFIDTVHPKEWEGKKACLVGIASGRAGNLRGLDHLASVLNYLKVEVYSQKPTLSSINNFIDDKNELTNSEYLELLKNQLRVIADS